MNLKLKSKFKKILVSALSAVTFLGVMPSMATTVHAESVTEASLYGAIAGLTGTDLSDKSTWQANSFLDRPLYGTSVGEDVGHVTTGDYGTLSNQTMDCVRFSLATVGHALQSAGADPTAYITQIGYNFNGNGMFARTTDYNTAQAGDILVYGEGQRASHMSVVLGWKDGEMWTISGSYSGHGPIIKKFSTTAGSGGNSCQFSAVYELPHTRDISVSVKKKSTCEKITNGNKLYQDLTATFGVYTDANCTSQLGTITTNSVGDGSASYTVSADVSTVYIKELTAPTNFELSDSSVHTVDVSSGSGSIVFSDTPLNDPIRFTLTKKDADGKKVVPSLAGAKFEVKYYDNLDASSASDVGNLVPAKTWVFKTIEKNGKYVVNIANKDCYVDGDELYEIGGAVTYPLGSYTVKEISAPTGYTVEGGYASTKGETIGADEEFFFKLENDAIVPKLVYGNNLSDPELIKTEKSVRGGFSVTKVDSQTGRRPQGDSSFANAQFDVYYIDSLSEPGKGITVMVDGKEYKPSEKVASITLDAKGQYTSADDFLDYGKYKLVETKAPTGMSKMADVEFDISDNHVVIPLTATEDVYDGDISIHKTYAASESSFAKNEEGAVFDIVASKYVKQYAADPENVTREDVINAYSHKDDWAGTDADGNAVTGYADMEYDQLTTNAKGKASSKKLAYGEYYLAQVSGKANYQVIDKPTVFNIAEEHQETLEFEATNKPTKYVLKMFKRDAETGELVTLNSAVFKVKKLTDAEGNDVSTVTDKKLGLKDGYISQVVGDGSDKTVYDTFKTVSKNAADSKLEAGMFYPSNTDENYDSENGSVAVPLELEAGTYRLEEVVTPDGFATGQSFEFTIDDNSITRVNEYKQNVIEVTMKDTPIKGNFSIVKSLDAYEGADKSLVAHDLTQFGFTFYADKDIINPDDGSVLFKKGDVVAAEKFADENGKANWDELPLGKYVLKETTQPAGTVKNDHEYKISISQTEFDHKISDPDVTEKDFQVTIDDEVVTSKDKAVDFKIENFVTKTEISKKTVTGNDELPGATLTLKHGDEVIDEWVSGETSHKIEGLTDGETYQLYETIAPKGFVRKTSAVEFTVDGKDIQKVVMKDKTYTLDKTDVGGNEVPGATITVTEINENGESVGEPVDKWTSAEEKHPIENLEEGKSYRIHEELAPSGYFYATDIDFTVTEEDKDVDLTMVDRPIVYEITKVDEKGNPVSGVKLTLKDITDPANPVDIELPNDGMTTDKPFVMEKNLETEHTYVLTETELIGGVYRANSIQFSVPKNSTAEKYYITMEDGLTGVYVAKTDETGKYVAGAKMHLEEIKDDSGKELAEPKTVYEFTSTDGLVDVSQYVKGGYTYVLVEDEVPFGYERPTVKDSEGKDVPVSSIFTVTGTQDEAQLVTFVNNRKHFYVSAVKVDANDDKTLLKGAEITVYNKKDNTVAKDVNGKDAVGVTDGKGNYVFEMPYNPDGYYIMETGAPEGYDINKNKFDVTLTEDYDFAKHNPIVIKVADSLLPIEESNSGVKGKSLDLACGAIGIGAVIGAATYVAHKKKKSEEDDTQDDSDKESE